MTRRLRDERARSLHRPVARAAGRRAAPLDGEAVLAVVASTQGSAPREAGATMVVAHDGCSRHHRRWSPRVRGAAHRARRARDADDRRRMDRALSACGAPRAMLRRRRDARILQGRPARANLGRRRAGVRTNGRAVRDRHADRACGRRQRRVAGHAGRHARLARQPHARLGGDRARTCAPRRGCARCCAGALRRRRRPDAAGADRAFRSISGAGVRQRPRRSRARRRARRHSGGRALDRFARWRFPAPGTGKRRRRHHGGARGRATPRTGRRVRRRDDAQPCARPRTDRGGARARRLSLRRPDRLAIEARTVRTAARRTRISPRRTRAYSLPDRRPRFADQGQASGHDRDRHRC